MTTPDSKSAIDKFKERLRLSAANASESGANSIAGSNNCTHNILKNVLPTGLGEESLESSYSLGPTLGTGLAGVVRLAEEIDTGKLRACKTITKDKFAKEIRPKELRAEIRALQTVAGHCHVVQLHALFEDKKAVHLIMDLCSGGDLYGYIRERRRLEEADAAQIFRQAASAIDHCHRRRVVHRDIKPENILLAGRTRNPDGSQSPIVKLADFGLAVRLNPGERVKGRAGSVVYMAPEVVKGHEYSFPADIWSLGIALYIALSGFMPFWGRTDDEIFEKICQKEPSYTHKPWSSISLDAKDLVVWMLDSNPQNRPNASQVLKHPWIRNYSQGSPPLSPITTPTSSHSPRSGGPLFFDSPLPNYADKQGTSVFGSDEFPSRVKAHDRIVPKHDGSDTSFDATHRGNSANLERMNSGGSGTPIRFQRSATPPLTNKASNSRKPLIVIPPRIAMEFGFNNTDNDGPPCSEWSHRTRNQLESPSPLSRPISPVDLSSPLSSPSPLASPSPFSPRTPGTPRVSSPSSGEFHKSRSRSKSNSEFRSVCLPLSTSDFEKTKEIQDLTGRPSFEGERVQIVSDDLSDKSKLSISEFSGRVGGGTFEKFTEECFRRQTKVGNVIVVSFQRNEQKTPDSHLDLLARCTTDSQPKDNNKPLISQGSFVFGI